MVQEMPSPSEHPVAYKINFDLHPLGLALRGAFSPSPPSFLCVYVTHREFRADSSDASGIHKSQSRTRIPLQKKTRGKVEWLKLSGIYS